MKRIIDIFLICLTPPTGNGMSNKSGSPALNVGALGTPKGNIYDV